MTRTLRGRLVLLLGVVVATACVSLVAFAVVGSAVLLRREQVPPLFLFSPSRLARVARASRTKI